MSDKGEENKKFCNAIANIRELIRQAQRDILHGEDDKRRNGMITVNILCAALTKAHEGDLSLLMQPIDEKKKETLQ